MVVVVMVTGQDLPHFLVAPDNTEEAASISSPQAAIWRTEGGTTVNTVSYRETKTELRPSHTPR